MTSAVTPDVERRIELALAMIELGGAVFPLKPGGKQPLIPKRAGGGGFLDAKRDPAMARTFLSHAGHPNYGVAFPEGSDVIVLDLDGGDRDKRPGWQQDWQRLYERLGPPGLTYIVRTPSGGRHAYYRWRTDLYGPIPPGDEMLGWTVRKPWKGYLVGPGSVVNGQTYEPIGLPTIADLPEPWIRAALAEKPSSPSSTVSEGRITVKGPAQVQVGGRHRFLRDRARHLVGLGLTGDALRAAILDLNRQLPEPKTEDEVIRAIGEAESKFEPDEVDPETGLGKPRGVLPRAKHGPPQVLDLPFYPARAVAEMVQEQIDWAWSDYLAYGTIVELVGPPKAGKTTLVFGLLRALVSGEEFLDRATDKGPVVVLTEQGPTSLRAVIARSGLAESEDVHFLLHRDARTADWQDVVETSIQHCRSVGARVLVVDTLPVFAGLAGETENSAGDALEAMQPLLGAAGEGLAVLVNRHRRKGGAPDIADEGRGSGAFSGTVDVILSLRRKEGKSRPTVRVLAAASRFDETPEELGVELVGDTYVVADDEVTEAATEILAYLSSDSHGGIASQSEGGFAKTAKDLVERTGKSRRTVDRATARLMAAGMLVRIGAGKSNDPHRYVLNSPGIGPSQTVTPYGGEQSDRLRRTNDPGPSETIDCHYYHDHQSAHVLRDGRWVCPICTEQEAASA